MGTKEIRIKLIGGTKEARKKDNGDAETGKGKLRNMMNWEDDRCYY